MPSIGRAERRARAQGPYDGYHDAALLRQHDAALRRQMKDYEVANEKARNLLLSLLPQHERDRFSDGGLVYVKGKMGEYWISAHSQTEIRKKGKSAAYSCLRLTVFAPEYDRMIAEYLLIKNNEPLYWKTANIFPRGGQDPKKQLAEMILAVFDAALLSNGIAWLIVWFSH